MVGAYVGQEHIKQVIRGLKGRGWAHRGPMCHQTDTKIKVPACNCMRAVSLPQHARRKAEQAWPGCPWSSCGRNWPESDKWSCSTLSKARSGRGGR